MHKVFIICNFVRIRGRVRVSFRVRLRVKFRVRVRVRFRVRFRVLDILPIFSPFFKFSSTKCAIRALILSYFFIFGHILSF